ncbi:MAG: hypothetical protein RI907_2128 [Pseudomonadota bacterium]|jgi:CDP-diacylglycerol--glycerol-3-phosphate 3-phosphatidyltransferase
MSLYLFKSRFQALLRPAVRHLAARGVIANQVTLGACAVSLALGLGLHVAYLHGPATPWAWLGLVPVWMLLRMALNAIDGMLAREHGQQSVLGAYLNELTDVVADAALFLPFAHLPGVDPVVLGAVVVLAALSEMAGLQGLTVGASRRYDGPMGKSDRALVFGAVGAAAALGWPLDGWLTWLMPMVACLTAWTVANRVRLGLAEARQARS